jgi:CSLREA domain-containing protein
MSRLGEFVFGLLAVAAAAGVANAATFNVNSTADAVDTNPGDGVCRTALVGNPCTLRAAIQEANALAGGDRINLTLVGTYALTINGVGENAAATGDLDVTSVISIFNTSGGTATVAAGGLAPRDRAFHVLAGSLALHNITVQGGGGQAFGGCILNQNSQVTLDTVTLQSCTATGDGGAIRSTGSAGRVDVSSSTFTGNTAANGGAIANDAQSTLSVNDTTFSFNTATTNGGAIFNHIAGGGVTGGSFDHNRAGQGGAFADIDADFDLTSTDMDSNTAVVGGAIFIDEPTGTSIVELLLVHATNNIASGSQGGGGLYAHHGHVDISESEFIANQATNGPGGGLVLDPETGISMTISQTTVSGNTAGTNGGGVAYPGDSDLLDIVDSTIDSNRAGGNGGGVWGSRLANNSTLSYSTISLNTATGNGGGLYLNADAAASLVLLSHATIAGNGAASGGGVYVNMTGTFHTAGTLIGNGTGGGNCAGTGTLVSTGFTLVQTVGACPFTSVASDVLGVNPNLGPLQNNGGPTATQAITKTSPAFDRGGGCGPFDQRGMPAPANAACDIGAYERQ